MKMKYYICPVCGELATNESIAKDCENGGIGLCMCTYMDYEWNPDVQCIDVIFPRRYTDYVEISEELYTYLGQIRNHVERIWAFQIVPAECRVMVTG
jgi:hypothetical protein